jgi:spore maturation protein CgeB
MNRKLLRIVRDNHFDLVLIAKGDTVNYNLIPIINRYSKTWYFFMDPLNISHEIRAHKYVKFCDWCSATTRAMTTLFKRISKKSYYVLEGYDEKIFNPGKGNSNKKIDVIFVGTIDSLREKYISYLRKHDINVLCHGAGWENKPIYLKKLVKKYRTSKIILNFPKKDSGFSDRVFHALGTGSFLLSKYCSDLKRLFKKRVHLEWFNSPEECLELVKYYLHHNIDREKIAKEGYNFALKHFTWNNTVEKIIQNINKNP